MFRAQAEIKCHWTYYAAKTVVHQFPISVPIELTHQIMVSCWHLVSPIVMKGLV